jgi:hypothetical protein
MEMDCARSHAAPGTTDEDDAWSPGCSAIQLASTSTTWNGPIDVAAADRAMTPRWSPRSKPRSRHCHTMAIDWHQRWSIGAVTATGECTSTRSASSASWATIICCCAGTPFGRLICAATTIGSRSARVIGAGARMPSRSLATTGNGYGLCAFHCCDRVAMSWAVTTDGITGEMVRDLMVEPVEVLGTATPVPPIEWLTLRGRSAWSH